MTTEDLGYLIGHCDGCGQPLDYCLCTDGVCHGCDHCDTEEI